MTRNQLQFWQNVETARANRAKEEIQQREAAASEVSAAAKKQEAETTANHKTWEVANQTVQGIGSILKGIGSIIPF